MKNLTPSQKGAAAEAAITAAVIQLGLTVLRPLCEGRRYDLVVDLEPRLLRVQCKLARLLDGVLSVHLYTSRFTPSGYVTTTYSAEDVDAVGVFSPEIGRCFLIPIAQVAGKRAIHLRLERAKNNQAQRINWAAEYDLEEMLLIEQEASRHTTPQLN
jgi:PD-(D/E)XK endonuclease